MQFPSPTVQAAPPRSSSGATQPLLAVRDVYKTYSLKHGQTLRAVDGVSFTVMPARCWVL